MPLLTIPGQEAGMQVADSLITAILGYSVVFLGLVLLMLVVILSLGAPIAPGTLILCLVSLLTQMGIDIGVISLVIGINFILEMLLAMVNSVGDVVVALLVARREGTLDLDTYKRI